MRYFKNIIYVFIFIIFLASCNDVQRPSEPIKYNITNQTGTTISEFSTKIIDKTPSRVRNLNRAADIINGYIVMPSNTFSFNNVVGEASEERGFEKAITLDRFGRKKIDDGGGICQISSTLYNAAEKADMKVIERHSHSKSIGYVKRGRDATIDYGNKDLKFINTKTYPIQIQCDVNDNMVIVKLINP